MNLHDYSAAIAAWFEAQRIRRNMPFPEKVGGPVIHDEQGIRGGCVRVSRGSLWAGY